MTRNVHCKNLDRREIALKIWNTPCLCVESYCRWLGVKCFSMYAVTVLLLKRRKRKEKKAFFIKLYLFIYLVMIYY